MNRRQLLNGACGIGLCSCAGALTLVSETQGAEINTLADVDELKKQNNKLNWWSDHTKKQLAKLWELLESHLNENTRNEIIEQLGRNCAKSLGWPEKFKGDPDGFFKMMKERYGEEITYDKEQDIISCVTPERDCVCGMVNSKITPAYFCHCSIGWQKEMYEGILGRSVECEIVESVLKGSKRCAFKNTIK